MHLLPPARPQCPAVTEHSSTGQPHGDDVNQQPLCIAEAGLDRARAADGVARLVARLHVMRARGQALRGQARDA
ncbi:MAG: hypothetical protein ACRDTT_18000, partial [Pseudonocardiaceae bacterium]